MDTRPLNLVMTSAPEPEPRRQNMAKERNKSENWINPYVRPITKIFFATTFCTLVVLAALGLVSQGFYTTPLFTFFLSLVAISMGLWDGERAALKVPGEVPGELKDDQHTHKEKI